MNEVRIREGMVKLRVPNIKANKRDPAGRHGQKRREIEDTGEIGMRMGELLLETLERRRDQLTMKSTVCAAAATALIFGAAQFLLNGLAHPTLWTAVPGVGVILAAGAALVESLNVVKRLPRRGRGTRRATVRHMLHFQTAARLGSADTALRLRGITAGEYIDELGMQAASLARNIAMRYTALGRAYVWIVICVACFVVGAATAVAHSYISPTEHRVVHVHRTD